MIVSLGGGNTLVGGFGRDVIVSLVRPGRRPPQPSHIVCRSSRTIVIADLWDHISKRCRHVIRARWRPVVAHGSLQEVMPNLRSKYGSEIEGWWNGSGDPR